MKNLLRCSEGCVQFKGSRNERYTIHLEGFNLDEFEVNLIQVSEDGEKVWLHLRSGNYAQTRVMERCK